MASKREHEAMVKIGLKLEETMRATLKEKGVGATGALADSIYYEVIDTPQGPALQRSMAFYGDFIEDGRGKGKQPPSRAIEEWIVERNITIPKGFTLKSLAFVIARKIGEQGYAPRPFIAPSINAVAGGDDSYAAKLLAEANALDLADAINDIDDVNINV